jgi:hypothetical protein
MGIILEEVSYRHLAEVAKRQSGDFNAEVAECTERKKRKADSSLRSE